LEALSRVEIDREQSLVRLALVTLGEQFPHTWVALMPHVAGGFFNWARRTRADLRSVIDSDAVKSFPDFLPPRPGTQADAVQGLADHLVSRLAEGDVDTGLIPALINILRVEDASLSGASLAGIEAYREPWELNVAPEVAA
jgi:hypothetical protein